MDVQIEEHTCATSGCGITFWFSVAFGGRRRSDKENFYCPNGHSLVYSGESDAQKVKRLEKEKLELLYKKNGELSVLRTELAKKKKSRVKK